MRLAIRSLVHFYITLLLPCSACQQQQANSIDTPGSMASKATNFMTNNRGDTILTGVPIPVQGKQIDLDTMAKPVTVPLPEDRKVIPAHPNVRRAGKPRVIPAAPYRTVVTPGENGVPLPRKVDLQIQFVPARQPQPVPAKPMSMKENARYDIQCLNIEHGLISSRVKAMHEDSRGYMWFATYEGGISRYDGRNFIHYTVREGANNDFVISIIEDKQGHLWFGTFAGDVFRYDGKSFAYFTVEGITPFKAPGFPRTWVSLADSAGNIWFWVGGYGVFRYDGENFTWFTAMVGLISHDVRAMLEDDKGNIWFGTNAGVSCYDGQHFTNYSFALDEHVKLQNAPTMLQDSRGDIWLGTLASGIYRFDGENFYQYSMKENLPSNSILSIMEDSQGNVWMGTEQGAVRYDGQYFIHFSEREGLSNNQIEDMLEDRGGNLWFGTATGGACRYDPNSFAHFSETSGLSHNLIKTIEEDNQGDIWFGTGAWHASGKGICRYDGDNFIQYSYGLGTIPLEIRSINQDSREYIWMTSPRGIHRLDGNNLTNYTPEQGISGGFVWASVEDSKGDMWFAMGTSGLNRYTPSKNGRSGYFTHYKEAGLSGTNILTITEDSKGHIWFGTFTYGMGKYDGKNVVYYTTNEGLSHNHASAPLEDSQGNYWSKTFGGGINFFRNPGNEMPNFIHFMKREGLVSNQVTDIEKDPEQRIWVSTAKGLSLFIPPRDSTDKELSPFDYRIVNFGLSDGLKSLKFLEESAFLDSKNRMWWGSDKGATMLDLNKFELPTEPPRNIGLAHLEIGQQFIDYGALARNTDQQESPFADALRGAFDSVARFQNYPVNLTLPYDLNHLTFHFTAIDWVAPHKIKYSYLLEGYDKNWSPLQTEPFADYRRLPHGNYKLKVKAIGEAGVWSEIFDYPFSIQPPWWFTWWAYVGYALLLISGIYYVYQFLLRKELAEVEAQRLQEMDILKARLYTNITHEFRTPLTVILGMAQQVKVDPKKWFSEGMNAVTRSGNQLLNMVNQMLLLTRLETGNIAIQYQQGNIIPYLGYLVQSFQSFAASRQIELQLVKEIESLQMDFEPNLLSQLMNNLLSNAIKFTPAKGKVTVSIKRSNDKLELLISDNGIGISEEHLPYIFDRFYQMDNSSTREGEGSGIGLALVKEIVDKMEGRINVSSESGIGTHFQISLPIRQEAPLMPETYKLEEPPVQFSTSAVLTGQNEDKKSPIALIIEDHADVVTYIASCIQNRYNIQTAPNGRVGIEKALELIPDIIICDVMMPEMDGYEVCSFLKQDERTSHIPIVMLTAKADMDARLEGLRRGADDYLIKPFNREELELRLENLIALRQKIQQHFATFPADASAQASNFQQENSFLQKLKTIVITHISDETFGIPEICRELATSRAQLHRKLTALTGRSTSHVIRSIRLQQAKEWLLSSDLNISEIAYRAGFKNPSHFTAVFSEEFGQTPTEMRKNNNTQQ